MMDALGYLLIFISIGLWFEGFRRVISQRRKRLGDPKPLRFAFTPPISLKSFNDTERKRLLAIWLATILLSNIGSWILRN